jgi:hypothetical protein
MSDDYRPMTVKEWAEMDAKMDAHIERSAEEYYRREAEEYERRRPVIEADIARIRASTALLPAPWVRAVAVRNEWPTDGYTAEIGPFRIEIIPGYVDDEDGGYPVWEWEARDTRIEGPFFGFASNGYCGDHSDIGEAAREAIECCRTCFDPAPEAEGAIDAYTPPDEAGRG